MRDVHCQSADRGRCAMLRFSIKAEWNVAADVREIGSLRYEFAEFPLTCEIMNIQNDVKQLHLQTNKMSEWTFLHPMLQKP